MGLYSAASVVRTQAELEVALSRGEKRVELAGDGLFAAYDSAQVTATGSAQVRAYNSAQVTAYNSAQVTAYDSARVTAYNSAQVTAYNSAQVTATGSAQVTATGSAQVRAYDSARVTAYNSAQVRAYNSAQVTATGSAQVTATGSAQVRAYDSARVTATGSAQVRAYDSARVTATRCVAVSDHGPNTKITGSPVIISIRCAETGVDWCDFYGVEMDADGVATVFKAVSDDWKGSTKTTVTYRPGETPMAPDFEPTVCCGHGLHFSPHPFMATNYYPEATKFVACPVKVSDMILLDDKVKARGCCAPVYECDIDGMRIGPAPEAPAKPKRTRAKKAS